METSVALSNAMRKDDRHKCQSLVWYKTTTIKLKRKELMTDVTSSLQIRPSFKEQSGDPCIRQLFAIYNFPIQLIPSGGQLLYTVAVDKVDSG